MMQHTQSSIVTIPTTILTATVAAGPGQHPPTSVHVPAQMGPIPPTDQPQVRVSFNPHPSNHTDIYNLIL